MRTYPQGQRVKAHRPLRLVGISFAYPQVPAKKQISVGDAPRPRAVGAPAAFCSVCLRSKKAGGTRLKQSRYHRRHVEEEGLGAGRVTPPSNSCLVLSNSACVHVGSPCLRFGFRV